MTLHLRPRRTGLFYYYTTRRWPHSKRMTMMNYDDYYAQQVGGALPYFAGARVKRGHGFGSLFGGLLRTVAPLIKRGALALGNRALKTGAQIAGDVLSGQNIRTAAKRRTRFATESARDTIASRQTRETSCTETYDETTTSSENTPYRRRRRRVFLAWPSFTVNRARA